MRSILGLVRPTSGQTSPCSDGHIAISTARRSRVGALLETFDAHPGRSGRNHLRVLARGGRHPALRGSTSCSSSSISPTLPGGGSRATRSGCGSGWTSRPRCSATRRCSSSTSPRTGSIHRASGGSGTCFARRLAEGRTVLISSHVLAEIAQTVDQVVIIHHGRLVQHATMAEVDAMAAGATRVRSPDEVRLASVLAQAGVDVRSLGRRDACGGRAAGESRRARRRERDRPARADSRARDASRTSSSASRGPRRTSRRRPQHDGSRRAPSF